MTLFKWTRDQFNNLLGSNITHIANAYSGADKLECIFHNNKIDFSDIKISRSDLSLVINMRDVDEMVRVPFNSCHRKERADASEYLSIFAIKRNATIDKICTNYRISANYSYIVTDNGRFVRSKYGGSVWEEENGTNHKP